MSSLEGKTVAVFGATGGTAQTVLALSLLNGLNARALARTPSKLESLLLSQPGITKDILDSQLVIVKGDARDSEKVKEVLVGPNGVVDTIHSGLGLLFEFRFALNPIKVTDLTICGDAVNVAINALEGILYKLPDSKKPSYSFISSIGVNENKNDVPFGYKWLYRNVLGEPHTDKYAAEKSVLSDKAKAVFRSVDIVKPTALIGTGKLGTGKGLQNVRVGTEDHPSLGYTINRTDVGEYTFEKVLKKQLSGTEPEQYCTIVDLAS